MQKLDRVVHMTHPGKDIEAAIRPEDPPPYGWYAYYIVEDTTGVFERFGYGNIHATMSVTGRTRTRLALKLREAELLDKAGTRLTVNRIRSNRTTHEAALFMRL